MGTGACGSWVQSPVALTWEESGRRVEVAPHSASSWSPPGCEGPQLTGVHVDSPPLLPVSWARSGQFQAAQFTWSLPWLPGDEAGGSWAGLPPHRSSRRSWTSIAGQSAGWTHATWRPSRCWNSAAEEGWKAPRCPGTPDHIPIPSPGQNPLWPLNPPSWHRAGQPPAPGDGGSHPCLGRLQPGACPSPYLESPERLMPPGCRPCG